MEELGNLINKFQQLLDQKYLILLQIETIIEEQLKGFMTKEERLDYFEGKISEKEIYLEQLESINDEFENLLEINKNLFGYGLEEVQQQIETLRTKTDQIAKISEKIMTNEKTVRDQLDVYLDAKRIDVKKFRTNKSVASKYNQYMKNTHQNEMSYFMDKKK